MGIPIDASAYADGRLYTIPCPAHGGDDPNCNVQMKSDGWMLKCWSRGCEYGEIAKGMGLDLRGRPLGQDRYAVAVYKRPNRRNPDGVRVSYRRDYPRDFADGEPCPYRAGGGAECGRMDVHKHIWTSRGKRKDTRVLFWGVDSPENELVVVEGEKAAARLSRAATTESITPVTCIGGAESPGLSDWSAVRDRRVLIFPDNDVAGAKFAAGVAALVRGAGAVGVRIVDVSGLPEKGDAADVADAGELLGMIADASDYDGEMAESVFGVRSRSTHAFKGVEVDELIRAGVDSLASGGDWAYLAGEFHQRGEIAGGWRWAAQTDDWVEHRISQEINAVSGVVLGGNHYARARREFSAAATTKANDAMVLAASERLRAVNLDSGELLEGTVYGGERVWTSGGEIVREKLGGRDFTLMARGYALPSAPRPTPKFDRFLSQVTGGSSEDALAIRQSVGMTLMGDKRPQVMIGFIGKGGSGKGTFTHIATALVGGGGQIAAYNAPSNLSGFGLQKAIGKSIVLFADIPARPSRNPERYDEGLAIMKELIADDPVGIDRKHRSPLSVRLPGVVWAATNFSFAFARGAEDAEAWERRLRIHRFTANYVERNPDLADEIIAEELPSIALRCMLDYAEGGLSETPAMARELSLAMANHESDLREWIDSAVIADAGGHVLKADLKGAYAVHLGRIPDRGEVMTLNRLVKGMAARDNSRTFYGVRLASSSQAGGGFVNIDELG